MTHRLTPDKSSSSRNVSMFRCAMPRFTSWLNQSAGLRELGPGAADLVGAYQSKSQSWFVLRAAESSNGEGTTRRQRHQVA
jgi:hypothetical protein